jgi:hypothetical protein
MGSETNCTLHAFGGSHFIHIEIRGAAALYTVQLLIATCANDHDS